MLAPVHRSVPIEYWNNDVVSKTTTTTTTSLDNTIRNPRESERDEWWKPRANEISAYIAEELSQSDIILLQEWWFNDSFTSLFDTRLSPLFHRITERRPGSSREDGMAILIRRKGPLQPLESQKVLTGPQRIGQILTCRESSSKRSSSSGRTVRIANAHLSYPSHPSPLVNERRQAAEIQRMVRALSKQQKNTAAAAAAAAAASHLDIMGGDFNSSSSSLPARLLEDKYNFVNGASASAAQSFVSGSGGRVGLGTTHCTHEGTEVSVDHVFVRSGLTSSSQGGGGGGEGVLLPTTTTTTTTTRPWGYLDNEGTRIVDCTRGEIDLKGWEIISDHRPVTVRLEWAKQQQQKLNGERQEEEGGGGGEGDDENFYSPLDPLEPPSWWNVDDDLIL